MNMRLVRGTHQLSFIIFFANVAQTSFNRNTKKLTVFTNWSFHCM